MKHFLYFLLLISFLHSCKSRNEKKSEDLPSSQYTPIVPKGMMDQINAADSAVIIYYKKPANPRFYRVLKVLDIQLLKPIIEDVNSAHITSNNNCPSLGKLYFYGKGDVVDVVYFSNADSCISFSFIKNGEKYFTRMGKQSQQLIDSINAYAK
ncbi:MAG: hypothetical protein RJB31_141 [Bacteroidota bacterium]